MHRRLVAAAVVALLAFTLTGCGGGGEQTAEEPPPAPDPAAAPAPGTPGEGPVIEDRSREETAVFEPFPTGDFVPSEVADRLSRRPPQPMLIFFFDEAQDVTDDTRKEVEEVRDANRGAIDLITYDLGRYTSINASGVVSADQKLMADERGRRAVTLARELGVTHLPFVVITDDQGYVIFKSRGNIDAQLLGRQVDRTKR